VAARAPVDVWRYCRTGHTARSTAREEDEALLCHVGEGLLRPRPTVWIEKCLEHEMQCVPFPSAMLAGAVVRFESVYVGRSAARMADTVNMMFTGHMVPSREQVSNLCKVVKR
jgi:hypothetical protein